MVMRQHTIPALDATLAAAFWPDWPVAFSLRAAEHARRRGLVICAGRRPRIEPVPPRASIPKSLARAERNGRASRSPMQHRP